MCLTNGVPEARSRFFQPDLWPPSNGLHQRRALDGQVDNFRIRRIPGPIRSFRG
jgi:hypothetical protein